MKKNQGRFFTMHFNVVKENQKNELEIEHFVP